MNNQIQLVLKSSTTELSLNDRELGIYLTPELEGLTGLPEIRTTSGVNAGYDGGWTSAQNYDARSITIRGVIANEDVATVEQLRRQLTTLAGQGKNEELTLDLVTQAGKAYTIQVRTIALEMSLQKVLTQQEFMLQLRADDPLVYDASETTHEALLRVAQATGGFTIDFELPLAITGSSEETIVNNEGLEQVPTVTRMYGELHNPKIINQTTNQFMQIEADLGFAEGEWTTPSEPVEGKNLTINGAPENAPLSDFKLKGETSQNGTPTPSAPVSVQTVTGENVVKICGKNLYKLNTGTYNGLVITQNSDGGYVLNGTPSSNVQLSVPIPEISQEHTLSYISSSTSSHVYIRTRDNEGTLQDNLQLTSQTSASVTSSKTITNCALTVTTGETFTNFTIYPQLKLGSSASSFEPYQGQSYEINLGDIELCKIGAYQDYIYKSGGKWYLHKEVGKTTFTSNTAWTKHGTTGGNVFMLNNTGFIGYGYGGNAAPALMDTARVIALGSMPDSANGVFGVNNGSQLRVFRGTYDASYTADTFKAEMVGHYIYGALATPTDTEITNEALIEQLEAILQEARMYSPQTNIATIYANGNEQGTLSISYFTDKNPDTRDELIIDSRLRTITLNGLDVYHLQAPGSEFLMLAPGENRLALQSDITGDNGYAQVSYKQGYLSI